MAVMKRTSLQLVISKAYKKRDILELHLYETESRRKALLGRLEAAVGDNLGLTYRPLGRRGAIAEQLHEQLAATRVPDTSWRFLRAKRT